MNRNRVMMSEEYKYKCTFFLYLKVNPPYFLILLPPCNNSFRFAKKLKYDNARWRCTVKRARHTSNTMLTMISLNQTLIIIICQFRKKIALRREISDGVKRKAKNTLNDLYTCRIIIFNHSIYNIIYDNPNSDENGKGNILTVRNSNILFGRNPNIQSEKAGAQSILLLFTLGAIRIRPSRHT